jgi:hypothetical protein
MGEKSGRGGHICFAGLPMFHDGSLYRECIRYMGGYIDRFSCCPPSTMFFMLYCTSFVRFTQRSLYCISKSTMNEMQKPYWKSDLLWFNYGYRKCMFIARETKFSYYIVRALLDLHNTAHVALANLWWTRCKIQIKNWTPYDLVMVIKRACLLITKPTFHVISYKLCKISTTQLVMH